MPLPELKGRNSGSGILIFIMKFVELNIARGFALHAQALAIDLKTEPVLPVLPAQAICPGDVQ